MKQQGDPHVTAPNDKPLISVIIPVYNGAEFIAAAVESAAAQTYRNLEIIVVDDGSSDDTLSILHRLSASDPRIRILAQANSGVAAARNHAIAESRGDFIAPLDADDLWLPTKIDRQLRTLLLAGDDCGFVYSWWAWIDEAGTVLDRSPRWTIEGSVLEVLVLINFTGNASVPLFRKHALVEAGGYNSALAAAKSGGCEDWEAVLRVAGRHRVAVVRDVLLGYRRRPGSMSQACDTMWRSQQMVMEAIRELRPDLNPALFRGSENQFRMYLAGLSFWTGNLRQALRWGLRAGLRLPVLTAPYVLKLLLLPRRRTKIVQTMRPGKKLDTSRIPEPLLPYDRILSPRQLPARIFWALAKLPREYAHRAIHALLLARMKREARNRSGKPRVLVAATWHFPNYSQTFVYREALALAHAGFDLRFVYAGLRLRTQLPDDLNALWILKRRILYADSTATRDLDYYTALMPAKVKQMIHAICAASGMTEEEVTAHRHFHHAFTFARFAEAWQPDYLHTYFFYEGSVFAFVASQLLDIPRGVSCYADHMVADYDLKLITLHMATCAVVVATSARIRRELEELCGHPLHNAIVKPNGIDATRFNPAQRAPSSIIRGVAVNRIHAKKGMTYLVEAMLLLRDRGVPFNIEICGEYDAHDPHGPAYFEQLKTFIATHKLESQVIFRGRQTAPEVRQLLSASDIFVAPFVELPNGDKDGIPTALLEAMAAGCAIVATDAGSITEVIDHNGHGLIVPQCDAAALADAIASLVSDNTLRTRLSHAAVERVRREFDVSVLEGAFHQRVQAAIAAHRVAEPVEVPA
jgi:glycosyltransferase involved in cell wall biosynthesis